LAKSHQVQGEGDVGKGIVCFKHVHWSYFLLKTTKLLIQLRENDKNSFHHIFELALAESEKCEVLHKQQV
jgi:hypothetical protein